MSPVRPLQNTGRMRDPDVEAQAAVLLACSPREANRLAALADRASAQFVKEEALVYLLRERRRRGDEAGAGEIAEILVRRCAGAVGRQIAVWRLPSAAEAEDCAHDVYYQMLRDLYDLGEGCEFWEIRFWLCLKRRVLNAVRRYKAIATQERSLTVNETRDEAEDDSLLDYLADDGAQSAYRAIDDRSALAEALALLPETERIPYVLWHGEGLTQAQIARCLGITDRTVRNRLQSAERTLATWRQRAGP